MSATWMTCAECSSTGLDTAVGNPPPKTGRCSSCGGPFPSQVVRPEPPPTREMTDDDYGRIAAAVREWRLRR